MAISKSDQLTNEESKPRVLNPARDTDARVRSVTWTFTPASEPAGSTIRFGTLKKGWRIQGMDLVGPIIGAATAQLSIGVVGTVAKYKAAAVVDAVTSAINFNGTDALFYGEVLAADTEIIGTTSVAALLSTSATPLKLVVRYTRD